MIMCRSEKSAKRTMESITTYIEKKLFLKVNREKTNVAECTEVKYLGFGYYRREEKIRIRVHPKSVRKMKEKIRAMTGRSQSKSHTERAEELKQYIRGWVNYYRLADMKSLAAKTDGWMRRRIRAIIWKQWKRPQTRRKELEKAGLMKETARKIGGSGKGVWRISRQKPIHRALGNEPIRNMGYLTFMEQYEKSCVS